MSPLSDGNILEKILQKRQDIRQAHVALFWAAVNFFILIGFYFEVSFGNMICLLQFVHPVVWYSACTIACICAVNFLINGYRFINLRLLSSNIELTETQQKLFGVSDNELGFCVVKHCPVVKSAPSPVPEYSESSFNGHSACCCSPPSVLSYSCNLSCSPQALCTPNLHGPLLSSISPVCVMHDSCTAGSPACCIWGSDHSLSSPFSSDGSMLLPVPMRLSSLAATGSGAFQHDVTVDRTDVKAKSRKSCSPNLSPLLSANCIFDAISLERYLQEHSKKQSSKSADEMQHGGAVSSSFWNYSQTSLDFLPAHHQYQYQLAPRSPLSPTCNGDGPNDCDSPVGADAADVWSRLGVDHYQLDHWVENLRKWLGNTIFSRIVAEIDDVNALLVRVGSEDVQVGDASLSTLKQVAIVKAQLVPQLTALLPYIDLIPNQEYLVQRIRDLACGGCMSSFKWNAGVEFKGKPWDETLPTDSRILIHLFCSYLDSCLPCHPKYPDGKTFTSQHFVITPDKPSVVNTKDNLAIYMTCIYPPHFRVVIEGTVWNVKQGRHNLFHTILLFLYHIKVKEHGVLRRVNLGTSGLNILWVFDT
jgi:hypothetical protein